jgi:predicted ATPase/signal transduction histidine kinase/class 3 adenylate cyclase/CheY-like chemotaxis protein
MHMLRPGPLDPTGVPTLQRIVARGPRDAAHRQRLQHELAVAGSLAHLSCIIPPVRLDETPDALVLVFQDTGTRPWSTLPRPMGREIGRFLKLAVGLTSSLVALHAERVMHLGLCPAALRLGVDEDDVRLIGLADASRLAAETGSAQAAISDLERLPYLSPEQTGRMNRVVDRRTDLYALGVVLYEVLTGELPLQADDALGWVHAHLARRPVHPGRVMPGVPEPICAVIMKLLAKDADERYRSAAGLLADWRLLLDRWTRDGELNEVVLGQRDVDDTVRAPERLYGRQAELQALEAAFARAAEGRPTAAWVLGEPGIGKSRLIRELDRPVTARGGLFAQGKGDQLRRNQPFDAPVQAFRGLLQQILAWPALPLATLRAELSAALGPNVNVLGAVMPELVALLPDCPPAPALGGPEAELRFRLTFQAMVEVLATREHPLVLFLDDLQWMDAASLALVEALIDGRTNAALCLVGAWRDGEVGPEHPVTEMRARLATAGHAGEELRLAPLGRDSLHALVTDALGGALTGPGAGELEALTTVIVDKTGANPFFVGRLLQALSGEGHIRFDHATGHFKVDLAAIGKAALAQNVAEQIGRDFLRLSEPTRQVLQCGAALGGQFCVADVAAAGQTPEAVLDALVEAARTGFVERLGPEGGGTFRFAHDHLQNAVYAHLSADARAALHETLARLRLEVDPQTLGEGVFGLAHHLVQARARWVSAEDRERAARALLAAGERAQSNGAPEAAAGFLRQGIEMLGEAPFEAARDLAAELHINLAQAERTRGRAEVALELTDLVDAHAVRAWDRVRTAELRVYLLNNLMRLMDAADHALALSATLGHPIAPVLSMEDVIACLGRVEAARGGREPLSLVELPDLESPEETAVVRILCAVLPTLAMAVPHMHVPAMTKALELGLTRGLTPDIAYATAHWAIILSASGQYDYAYTIGQLTNRLRDERFADRPTIAGLVEMPMMTQHFVEPVRNCATSLHWGMRRSLELGHPTGYGYCANQALNFDLLSGEPLAVFEQNWRRIRAGVVEHQQWLALGPVDTWGQMSANLLGMHAGDPSVPSGPRFDYATQMAEFRRIGVTTSTLFAVVATTYLSTVFNDPARVLAERAEYAAELAAPINLPTYGQILILWFALLARLDLNDGLDTAFLEELERLRGLARQVPVNHAHRVDIIDAELAMRAGDAVTAGARLEAAFTHARAQKLLGDAAIIAERGARLAERMGSAVITRAWRRETIESYATWGATAKVERLRAAWPDAGLDATQVAHAASATLDLDAVLRAAETIAGEMDLDRLLSRTMRLVCEAAGAERGALVLDRGDRLLVEAVAEGDEVEVLGGRPLADHPALSPEMVQFVARGRETLLIPDAAADVRFARTPYVANKKPRSILCTALVHRGHLTGVLYLENNLTTGAFTADRVETLRLLAFQAATSIENAVLYAAAQARAEELRAKNEALSAIDRLKDELLARTSHELRTPLHGIIGLAQAIGEGATGLDRESRHSLNMIVSSGRRLANLINDILDFQTLKRREIALGLAAVSVREAVGGVLDLCRPLLAGRPIDVVDAVPARDFIVSADPDRLAQILLNLVGNAIKFTERGSVRIEAQELPDGDIEVRVVDTGIGMSPDVQARIFEAFEQGDAGIARQYGGAGLGLSVARQLVELHGGKMRVESTLGAGSTFAFTLRGARGAERLSRANELVRERVTGPMTTSQPNEIVAVSTEGHGRRILVVDDEPVNVQVALTQLARAGYEVATALNGPDALRMVAEGLKVDAVLLDVMMPRMDGYEVCARLRERYAVASLPVIMLTAKNQVTDLVQGLEAGANDYVTKPFTGQELLARLRTHLRLSHVNLAIGQFVPYPFLRILGRESITDVRLGDSVAREMSVLFANMRAFTRLTEQMTPEECFRFVNRYFGLLAPAVLSHGGFVDKYIGDAVMALFEGPADAAIESGLAMNRALLSLNDERLARGQEPVRIGVGINTGQLVLGTVGSEKRMDTTVISEAVNVASRLQALTRRYDTQLLVTEQTMAALRDRTAWPSRMLDHVQIPGRAAPIPVYEIYAAEPDLVRAAKDATRPTFEQAVRAFHARSIPEAARLFALCQALNPMDAVVRQYVERCQKIQMQFAGGGWGAES